MISLFLFFILFWGWSVGVVHGPVRRQSVDPVRSGVRGPGVSVFGLPHLVHVGSGKYFDLIILTLM